MLAAVSSQRHTLISYCLLLLVEKYELLFLFKEGLYIRSVEPIEVEVEIPFKARERQVKNTFCMSCLLSLIDIV